MTNEAKTMAELPEVKQLRQVVSIVASRERPVWVIVESQVQHKCPECGHDVRGVSTSRAVEQGYVAQVVAGDGSRSVGVTVNVMSGGYMRSYSPAEIYLSESGAREAMEVER